MHSGRCTCFEAPYREPELPEIIAELCCRPEARRTGYANIIADEYLPGKESSGAENDRITLIFFA